MSPHLPPDPLGSVTPPPSRPARSGCATVLLGLLGFMLLVPGLCVLGIAALSSGQGAPSLDAFLGLLPLLTFLAMLFVGGILLIRAAFRG